MLELSKGCSCDLFAFREGETEKPVLRNPRGTGETNNSLQLKTKAKVEYAVPDCHWSERVVTNFGAHV